MIHISLQRNRIDVINKRCLNLSFPLILPLALQISKLIYQLNRANNLSCNLVIKIGGEIYLEVKND